MTTRGSMPDPKPPSPAQLEEFRRLAIASLGAALGDANVPLTPQQITEHMWHAGLKAQLPGMSEEVPTDLGERHPQWKSEIERIFKTALVEFPGGFTNPGFRQAVSQRLKEWTATISSTENS